jgi:hypothetical protein
MNTQIIKMCDNANLDEIKQIPARYLPIKHMIIYLESKLEEYNFVLTMDNNQEILYLKLKTIKCLSYLKKIQ